MNLRMCGIVKSFGANNVLQSVDFHLNGGEVCALLGENGAGKSTLMNILGGVLQPDQGTIELDGKKVLFQQPSDSLNAGIAFIHQELNLINDLPVYENMFIGHEIRYKSGFLNHKEMIRQTQALFDQMELPVNPRAMVSSLDSSYKQIVEISRALLMKASIIIMDEPTTSLTEPEIERVFDILRKLKQQKIGVVFISHKLREVKQICDRYTVLRDGRMIEDGAVADVTIADISRAMVGHEVSTARMEGTHPYGDCILELEALTQEPYYRQISLKVHSGEVLGITGLLGDGRSELFQTVFGAHGAYSGNIRINGKKVIIRSSRQALKLGIGYLPGNRKECGIVRDMNILENGTVVTWPKLTRFGFLSKRKQLEAFSVQRSKLRIKMENPSDSINSLSGGNQQKVILAKWLSANPQLLILDNPTCGVDVGAKEEIYDIIRRLAREGVAIVVLSNEAQEIVRLCDRALILYHGTAAGFVKGEEMNEQTIMRLATGG